LLQQAARGACVGVRDVARDVGLRLDQLLEPLLLVWPAARQPARSHLPPDRRGHLLEHDSAAGSPVTNSRIEGAIANDREKGESDGL